jgi:hypothetical protein
MERRLAPLAVRFKAHQARVIAKLKNTKTVFSGSRDRPNYIVLIEWTAMASHLLLVNAGHAQFRRSKPMRKIFLIATILGGALVSGNAIANAAPAGSGLTVDGNAPVGHLQPRAQQFAPSSQAEQAVQQQQSIEDAQEQKLDEQLDKQLNICRGC